MAGSYLSKERPDGVGRDTIQGLTMKISLLHYSAPPIVGGVESVVEHHARLMADDGHQVQVIAGRGAQFDPRIEFVHTPHLDSRDEEVLAVKQQLDQGVVSDRFDPLASTIEKELGGVL